MTNKKMWLGSLLAFLSLAIITPVSAKTTQQILDSALVYLRDAQTVTFSGTVAVKTKYKKVKSSSSDLFSLFATKDSSAKMSFKGAVDVTDPEFSKVKLDLNYVFPVAGKNSSVNVNMVQGGKSYYFFLNSPELEKMASSFIDLSVVTNKWIEFNLDSFLEQMKSAGLDLDSTSLSSASSIDPLKEKALIKSLQKNKVLKAVKLADSKINGQTVNHLVLTLNRVGLQNFLIDYAKIAGETMTAKDKKDLSKKVAALKLPNIDLWVDKAKGYPVRFSFRNISDSKYYTTTSDVVFNMAGFDKPADIEIPFSAEPIENVFNSLKNQIASSTASSIEYSTTASLDTL